MMIRKLFQGWGGSWIFEWRWFFQSKIFYFTPCHVGLEAGTYIGGYFEMTVVILGVGFYIKWHPPTEGKKEFMDGMNEAMKNVRKDFDITEDPT